MSVIARDPDIDRILAGQHNDPFSFLGMHETGEGLVVRTFQPEANRVDVIKRGSPDVLATLSNVRGSGLFAGAVPGRRAFDYRLRIKHDGAEREIDERLRTQ